MTIPSHILSRLILTQRPELNISETQLTEDIQSVMSTYHPYKQLYGVITHQLDGDYELAKICNCSFCGHTGLIYHGWKRVKDEQYLAFFECPICGHTEEL